MAVSARIASGNDAAYFATCRNNVAVKLAVSDGAQAHGLALTSGEAAHLIFSVNIRVAHGILYDTVKSAADKGADIVLLSVVAHDNALFNGTVSDRNRIDSGAAAAKESRIQSLGAGQQLYIVNGHTIGVTVIPFIIFAVIGKPTVNQAVAIDFAAINIQVLNGCRTDIMEERLSTLRNCQGVISAVKNAAKYAKSHIRQALADFIVIIDTAYGLPILWQSQVGCHQEFQASAVLPVLDQIAELLQVLYRLNQERVILCTAALKIRQLYLVKENFNWFADSHCG